MSDGMTNQPIGRAAASAFPGRLGTGPLRPNLELAEYSPRLMAAYLFSVGMTMKPGRRLEHRGVFDYEMEFILEGTGSQLIEDREWPVKRGDLVFRRPGTRTQGIMPYSCLTIIFDLEGRYRPRPVPYFSVWASDLGSRAWLQQPNFQNSFLDRIPAVFHPASGDIFRTLFETCLRHFVSPGEGSELVQKASILQMLYHLNTEIRDPLPRLPESQGNHHQKLQAVLAYMRRNYRRRLPLKELGEVAALSPTYLHRVFSQTMGQSPLDHLKQLRMEAARDLLATSDLSASSVAMECGFENVPYFFTQFRKATGLTPAVFRERYRFLP